MKKKELLRRIEKLEFRIVVEEKTRRADYEIIALELEALKERLNAISRIHSNHTAEDFKRNKHANERINILEEGMQLLMLKDMVKGMINITEALEKQEYGIDNGCKKCDEKPQKKHKKCEKTGKAAPKAEELAEIKAGDIVKIIKSESDHIEEIRNMIGKEYKVRRTGKNLDGTISYYIPSKENSLSWAFSRKEIELVEKKKGRGRPVGSKNNNKKGEK